MSQTIQSISIDFPSVGAGTDDEVYGPWPFPGTWQIEQCHFGPATAAAAHATNNAVCTVSTNDGAGGAFTSIGNFDTSTTANAVDTKREITVSGAGLEIVEGSMIKVAKTEGGTGAILHGSVGVVARKVR